MSNTPGLRRPQVVAFDIIETTFDIEPLGEGLAGLGLPPGAHRRLYAETLRDAVSLACIGRFAPFMDVMVGALAGMLAESGRTEPEVRLRSVLAVMRELPPHPDAAEAFAHLHQAGIRVFALSNGAEAATRALLNRAGMSGFVEAVLSVEMVGLAKPRAEVYRHAVATADVDAGQAMLAACHPWDVTGAKAAGLAGGYVARGKPYPATMIAPDLRADSLLDLATAITRLPA